MAKKNKTNDPADVVEETVEAPVEAPLPAQPAEEPVVPSSPVHSNRPPF